MYVVGCVASPTMSTAFGLSSPAGSPPVSQIRVWKDTASKSGLFPVASAFGDAPTDFWETFAAASPSDQASADAATAIAAGRQKNAPRFPIVRNRPMSCPSRRIPQGPQFADCTAGAESRFRKWERQG